ncbi:gamma-glutamylcyclotransferase family protein [Frankia sp. R82]|uniref:gamma-glutamylcyclotransferase family protein n=1 Tax=Frankia sp. R82 TaxID=2950553 RepID=UPI002043562C|nr:gamma-glutamylcyclotransferase family protein [Frankia sp. R82]MCM3886952.1 gamma-glutamylcyclotransferase [Frankia sp. R82]
MFAPAGDRRPLFVYGTLMFPAVLTVLLARVPRMEPVAVSAWRAACLLQRPYPGLVPDPGARTCGQLLLGLDDAEVAILDAFEGPAYEVGPLVLTDGRAAFAYLWRDLTQVSTQLWDPQVFAERHLVDYARRCAHWRARFAAGRS